MAKPKRKNQETSLSNSIRAALTAKGCRCIRIQAGIIPALYGATKRFIHCAEPGTPDMLVIAPGRPSASLTLLEVKTKTGRLSPEQVKFHQWAQANGVRSIVARSISDAVAGVFGSVGA